MGYVAKGKKPNREMFKHLNSNFRLAASLLKDPRKVERHWLTSLIFATLVAMQIHRAWTPTKNIKSGRILINTE